MLAVDTTILVYAHRREVAEHPCAYQVLQELAESLVPWAIPWPCLYDFFSVVTTTKIWRQNASEPQQASSQLEAWLASPSIRLIGETEDLWAVLGPSLERPRVRGPAVHDARIAAICLAHGVEALLTRDRDFSLFPELPVRIPL